MFCTYVQQDEYRETLISCAPLMEERYLRAYQHFNFLMESLAAYKKSVENVARLIGDNFSVNKTLSTLTGKALIGCYSHTF